VRTRYRGPVGGVCLQCIAIGFHRADCKGGR
jgi:hypothetical protein